MQFAKKPELRRVEFGDGARDAAANVVGQIDIDVIQIEVYDGTSVGGGLIEVFRNYDNGGGALLSDGVLGFGCFHIGQEIGVGVGAGVICAMRAASRA